MHILERIQLHLSVHDVTESDCQAPRYVYAISQAAQSPIRQLLHIRCGGVVLPTHLVATIGFYCCASSSRCCLLRRELPL